MTTATPPLWDGTCMSPDYLSVVVLAAGGEAPGTTAVQVIAAGNGPDVRIVPPEQLGRLIRAHSGARLLCHDVGGLCRAVSHHFAGAGDREAQQALRQFVEEGRVYDVGLLDQLVRLAVDGSGRVRCSPLPQLAHQLGGLNLRVEGDLRALVTDATGGGAADARAALEAEAGPHAQALSRVFEVLRPRLHPLRLSPLSLALQVKGAVALAGPSDGGLLLGPGAMRLVVEGCIAARDRAASALLAGSNPVPWLKRSKSRRPHWGPDGGPEIRADELRVWLAQTAAAVRDLHQHELFPPRTGDGQVSDVPTDWAEVVWSDRLLTAWYDLMAAAELACSFGTAGGGTVHPAYTALPRLRSHGPDLDALRRFGVRGIFVPSPGHVFLELRLPDLPLRALASVCRASGKGTRLADLFAGGSDPVAHAAAALNGPSVACVATLLSAACRGLSVDRVCEIVREQLDLADPGQAKVKGWYRRLTDEVFPELGLFLQDDTLAVMAANLGTTTADLCGHLDFYWPHKRPPLPQLRKWLREYRKLAGRTKENLKALLEHCAVSGPVPALLGAPWFADDALYRALFSRRVVTRTGRVRGGLSFSQARSAEHLDLADDAAKAALFAVAAAGYLVAAFAEGTILVELPDGDRAAGEVAKAAELAGRGAVGALDGLPAVSQGRLLRSW
jgi:hypothetical protein